MLLRLMNLGVLVAFLWAVQHYWGWGRLLKPWQHLQPEMISLAIVGMLISYGLRGTRVYFAERDIPRKQPGQALRLILISNVFNLLLPMRSGEASFPLLMRRWFGTDVRHATGTLAWLRLLDLHVLAAAGVVCAARGWLAKDAIAVDWAPLVAILVIALPIAVFASRSRVLAMLEKHSGRIAHALRTAAEGLPTTLCGLFRDLALTWLAWGIKLASLGFVFSNLAGLSPPLGILGAIGGDLSTVLPIHAPGGFGTYEAGVLLLVAPGQHPGPQLLAAAVDLHLLVLATALVAGAAAWLAPGHRR